MAVRLSPALQNYLLAGGTLQRAFDGGRILIYSGSQPTTPNLAPTGTLLCTITNNSLSRTAEVQAVGSVTLNTGGAGSVNTITVAGITILRSAVNFNSSLNQTASDVISAINNYVNPLGIIASSGGGAVINLTMPKGTGTRGNALTVASTVTTITKTDVNTAGGVDSVNGLHLDYNAVTGQVSILGAIASQANYVAEVWSGVVSNAGTAGWFRFEGSVADAEALDNSAVFLRLDGAVATSGAELNITNTTLVASATETVTSFQVNEPAQ